MARKSKKNVSRKKRIGLSSGKKKRRTTAREIAKFAALNPRFFSRVKQEFHDFDYIDKLDDKNKALLNSFIEETLNARFNHNGKKLYKSKKAKREMYRDNNSRQRDVTSLGKARGKYIDIDPNVYIEHEQSRLIDQHLHILDFEDAILKPEETPGLLTKREFIKLMDSGAYVPMEIIAFYEEYYNLPEESSVKPSKKR